MTKTAAEELVEYGYVQDGDDFVKFKAGKPREKWTAVDGGFLRFTRSDGEWVAVPYAVADNWKTVSGLTFEEHPEAYDLVYPEEYVRAQYEGGNASRAEQAAARAARQAAEAAA